MNGSGYRRVLATPGVAWLLGTCLVARFPFGMVGLGIVLHVSRTTGSYAEAGVATAVYVLSAALTAPVLGMAADRWGRRPVLAAAGLLNGLALVGLAFTPVHRTGWFFLVAAVAGLCTPPTGPSVRARLPELLDRGTADAAFAVDATLQELIFIGGPALVALVDSTTSTAAPIWIAGLFGIVGNLAVIAHPAMAGRGHRQAGAGRRARPSSGVATVAAIAFVVATGLGTVEVAVAGFAGAHHHANQAGLALTAWSFGSMVGGVAMGQRMAAGGTRILPRLLAAVAVGFGVLAVAPDVPVLAVLLALGGAAIAPLLGTLYGLVSRLAAAGSATAAFGWLVSGIGTGAAAGAALGGILTQTGGARVAFLVAGGAVIGVSWLARSVVPQWTPGATAGSPAPRAATSSRSS